MLEKLDRARNAVLTVVGFTLSVVAWTFAVVAVIAVSVIAWRLAFGGDLVKPGLTLAVTIGLAVAIRFLADLDKYEYVAPPTKTVTTRRSSTGTPSNRKTTTQTTTKTTGGAK